MTCTEQPHWALPSQMHVLQQPSLAWLFCYTCRSTLPCQRPVKPRYQLSIAGVLLSLRLQSFHVVNGAAIGSATPGICESIKEVVRKRKKIHLFSVAALSNGKNQEDFIPPHKAARKKNSLKSLMPW